MVLVFSHWWQYYTQPCLRLVNEKCLVIFGQVFQIPAIEWHRPDFRRVDGNKLMFCQYRNKMEDSNERDLATIPVPWLGHPRVKFAVINRLSKGTKVSVLEIKV
jgi:hypothetical protein